MNEHSKNILKLRVGDIVQVRAISEILATLDEHGRLESLPFMPEMLKFCGKRFRVVKRADKTCDPSIQPWSLRRMKNAVHLEGLRCDGLEHGGCDAGCLIFWKEAWLKKVDNRIVLPAEVQQRAENGGGEYSVGMRGIRQATREIAETGVEVYRCQATEVRNFTTHLPGWDIRHYLRDLRSGNISTGIAGNSRAERVLEIALGLVQLFRQLIIAVFNRVQSRRHGVRYPAIEGKLQRTPTEFLNLQPGELVQVRSREEIVKTLSTRNENRGLGFDPEMVRYCGGIYRVLRRVRRIIEEKTGRMLEMKHPCIILEGVACQSNYHRYCPRGIYHYWRESWLKRANEAAEPAMEPQCEAADRCPFVGGDGVNVPIQPF